MRTYLAPWTFATLLVSPPVSPHQQKACKSSPHEFGNRGCERTIAGILCWDLTLWTLLSLRGFHCCFDFWWKEDWYRQTSWWEVDDQVALGSIPYLFLEIHLRCVKASLRSCTVVYWLTSMPYLASESHYYLRAGCNIPSLGFGNVSFWAVMPFLSPSAAFRPCECGRGISVDSLS